MTQRYASLLTGSKQVEVAEVETCQLHRSWPLQTSCQTVLGQNSEPQIAPTSELLHGSLSGWWD